MTKKNKNIEFVETEVETVKEEISEEVVSEESETSTDEKTKIVDEEKEETVEEKEVVNLEKEEEEHVSDEVIEAVLVFKNEKEDNQVKPLNIEKDKESTKIDVILEGVKSLLKEFAIPIIIGVVATIAIIFGISFVSTNEVAHKNPNLIHFPNTQTYLFVDTIEQMVPWENKEVEFSSLNIWTDMNNIYYSDQENNIQYKLDQEKGKWEKIEWLTLPNPNGQNVWTDGVSYYYSEVAKGDKGIQYVYNSDKEAWEEKTWKGLTNFNGYNVWSDVYNIYYSDDDKHYVLDVEKNIWKEKEWKGLEKFDGKNAGIKDGSFIAYENENSREGTVGTYILNEKGNWEVYTEKTTDKGTTTDVKSQETTDDETDKEETKEK